MKSSNELLKSLKKFSKHSLGIFHGEISIEKLLGNSLKDFLEEYCEGISGVICNRNSWEYFFLFPERIFGKISEVFSGGIPGG